MKKTHAGNPIITGIYTADPSAHSWDAQKLYVYASRDVDPPRGCDLMDKQHVFSTTDMANWTDEGEIIRSDDVDWGRPEGGFMWAPDCAYKNGKYYYYFPHPSTSDWNNSWKIGVAVSDFPNKGFKDIGYIKGLGGFALIDPAVFTDDDGQTYIYYGGGGKCFGGKLKDDMFTLDGEMLPMEGLFDFHEAAWVFKRNGLYYLTHSDNFQPENNMRYSVSKSPLGSWTPKGVYLTSVGCETTHGSVVLFKQRWYQFYHNNSISGRGNLRSVCVDELFFEENGDIRQVVQTTEGVKALDGSYNEPERTLCTVNGSEFIVNSVEGGRANLLFRFKTAEKLAKIRLTVNGVDESFMNCLGALGETNQTVLLNKGKNVISVEIFGNIEILSLEATFLD